MPRVSRSIEVATPSRVLMSVICDFERYPEFVPTVLDSDILDIAEDFWRVSFDVALFRKRVSYTLDLRKQSELSLEWNLVSGDWMTKNEGSWELADVEDELTRATYSIEITLDTLLPQAVDKLLINASFPRLLRDFKGRAEGVYENRQS